MRPDLAKCVLSVDSYLNTLQSCVIYNFKGNFVLVRDILLTPIFK